MFGIEFDVECSFGHQDSFSDVCTAVEDSRVIPSAIMVEDGVNWQSVRERRNVDLVFVS